MFNLDLEPLSPRLLQNWEAHINYLKYTQEYADILWGIVKQAKAKQPLDKELDFSFKHAQRIKELLVYVQDTCPNAIKLSAKKVDVTPKNNVKKVRFVEPLTSSSNIKQVESSTTSNSNTPVLSPTGLKCSTSNCGSKPTCNKKNDRILRNPSRNMKNKVEAQPRKVNKKNSVVEPIRDVDVKHSLLNANSEPICATYNKSMFNGVHDMSLLDFVENVNSHAKSAKKHTKQNIWKPTANVVPPKKPTSYSVETQKPELKFYSRKPKNVKNVGSSKKAKIVESKNANHSEPNHTWGSNATDIPSSSSLVMTGCLDYSLASGLRMFKMYDREPLLAHELSSNTKSWLWHRRLSHLNFGTLNKIAKDGLARSIPRLKFQKDHLCSACALGKSKKSSHQPKAEDANQEKLYLLYMDLCGPMRVASINGKSYGTECVNQTLREFYENVGISHQTSVARTPQQNDVVERRNQTLVEAARTMLIFSKAPLFLWAEAINTAYNEDLGKLDAKADIGIFLGYMPAKKVFRIYNKRTHKIIETIHVTFDELIAMASKQFSSGPGLHFMNPATSSSGLVPNTVSQQPCIPPTRDDWDHLFQPMFDEYFNPPSIDAPSTSIPSTQEQEHSLNISQGFKESPKTPTFRNDQLHESLHEDSTSQGSSSNVKQTHTPFEHLGKWTKNHPIANVIGGPSRAVSTRKQLQTDAMWCYFNAFLTVVEPKNFKQAMTKPSWIDAIQEEIHKFERL
ncbi:retrovirus-related pol polyprotein from transposon TNT 1-94 [Tanacetum coccineum]